MIKQDDCQARINHLEDLLRKNSSDLRAAEELWQMLGNCVDDLRSGLELIRIFRHVALENEEGVIVLAKRYRELAYVTGEYPRRELFDSELLDAIKKYNKQLVNDDLCWLYLSLNDQA